MTDKLPSAKFPPYDGIDDSIHIEWPRTKIDFSSVYPPSAHADMVNSPPHYTKGKFEAIEVIEDAVQHAPNSVYGTLQWQVLKYILRMWNKNDALEDARKARWYLDRLIYKLETK